MKYVIFPSSVVSMLVPKLQERNIIVVPNFNNEGHPKCYTFAKCRENQKLKPIA